MHRGYVLLWRRVEDAGWIKNHKLWSFWSWCLIKASYKKKKVVVGLQEIDLEPGQFIFGRKAASKATGISEKSIRTIVHFLVNSQNLAIKTANKFSIFSIVNWHIYQQPEIENGHQNGQQLANNWPTTGHKQSLKKEKKNTYSPDFEQFYAAYPKKRDPDRAWKSWQNRNGDRPDISVILESIKKQCLSTDWKKDKGRFIPYPATWLNAGAWKNEVDIEESGPFG